MEAATTRLGYKEVPYRQVEYNHDTPEAIALMDADNKLGELSDWDYDKLEGHFEDLKLQGFNLQLTGFNDDEINLSTIYDGEIPDEEPEFDESIADGVEMIKCPECGHEFPK